MVRRAALKNRYFQKDIGGKTRRTLIGRFPIISAQAARQTALELSLQMARGAGKAVQIGAPTLQASMESYLARPKLRSEAHKLSIRQLFDNHLSDWMKLRLDEISKSQVVDRHRALASAPSTANHTQKYFRTVSLAHFAEIMPVQMDAMVETCLVRQYPSC